MRWGRGKKVTGSAHDYIDVARAVHEELYGARPPRVELPSPRDLADQVPRAPAPPVLTPELWARSCIQRARRCDHCEICAWEKKAEQWHYYSPWREGQEMPIRTIERPAFPSLDIALQAWLQWEQHNRWAPSGSGVILELLRRAATVTGPRTPKRDNPLLRRLDDVVHVELALERAFRGSGNRWGLEESTCRALLLARTHGVIEPQPLYKDLARLASVTEATARSLVKTGRRAVLVELCARRLVPMPARASGLHWDIDCRRRELLEVQL